MAYIKRQRLPKILHKPSRFGGEYSRIMEALKQDFKDRTFSPEISKLSEANLYVLSALYNERLTTDRPLSHSYIGTQPSNFEHLESLGLITLYRTKHGPTTYKARITAWGLFIYEIWYFKRKRQEAEIAKKYASTDWYGKNREYNEGRLVEPPRSAAAPLSSRTHDISTKPAGRPPKAM